MGGRKTCSRESRTLGEGAIDEFIVERQSEKCSWTSRARQTMAQATFCLIATATTGRYPGFANSEGGVVWGVDCRRNQDLGDVAGARAGGMAGLARSSGD